MSVCVVHVHVHIYVHVQLQVHVYLYRRYTHEGPMEHAMGSSGQTKLFPGGWQLLYTKDLNSNGLFSKQNKKKKKKKTNED